MQKEKTPEGKLVFPPEFAFCKDYSRSSLQKKTKKMADLQGFEPRQSEPESLVLPLHHRSALCHKIYHRFGKLQVDFLKISEISHRKMDCTRRIDSVTGAK